MPCGYPAKVAQLPGPAQRGLANDAKRGTTMILAHQRKPIDPNGRVAVGVSKPVLQEGVDRPPPILPDSSRQRHVKAELLEYVRVSPAVEVGGLVSAEPGRQASASFLICHRQAEALEGRDAVCCEPVKRR